MSSFDANLFDAPATPESATRRGRNAPLAERMRPRNLSEFAGSGGSVSGATDPEVLKKGAVPNGFSSAGGQTHNPHALSRGPSGSSGGTGAGAPPLVTGVGALRVASVGKA